MIRKQEFCFIGVVQGLTKKFIISVPVENGSVYINRYRPKSLPGGNLAVDTFDADCQKQVISMTLADAKAPRIDAHIAGLMAVVMDYIVQHRRLSFADLLVHIDCFSLLLEAAGFSDAEIRDIYPRVTKTMAQLFSDYICL